MSHSSVVLHLQHDEVDSLVNDCFTQHAVVLLIPDSLHLMSAVGFLRLCQCVTSF